MKFFYCPRALLTAIAILLFSSTASMAADTCNEGENKGTAAIDAEFVPKIELTLKISKALQDKGLDPRKFPIVSESGDVEVLDLVDLVEKLANKRADGYQIVRNAKNDCEKALKPYQDVVDAGVLFATGGLASVLPERFKNIDVSQILSGHPLGGPNALIPKMRDDILNGLGIGGDVAKIIRDPKCVFGGC